MRFCLGPQDAMGNFKRIPGSLRRSALSSFTLVEVVIAIAVIGFVLVSILGLMAYASQLVQQSDNYSRLSNISGLVLSQFESQPYSVSTNAATANSIYYYTYEGLPTNSSGAYYQCSVTNADPSNWTLTNVMQVQVTIRWPKPQFTNTNVIITSTLNYD